MNSVKHLSPKGELVNLVPIGLIAIFYLVVATYGEAWPSGLFSTHNPFSNVCLFVFVAFYVFLFFTHK